MQGSGRAIAATIIVVMGATTVAATIPHGKAPVVRAERTVIGPPMGSDLLKLMTATTSSTTVVPTTTTVPPVTIEPTTELPPPPPVPVVKAPPPVAAPEPAPEPVAPVAPPVAPKPVPVDTSDSLSAVVDFALAQLGDPYLWAGNGPDQWDCSGLMVAAYRQIGITIPRTTWGQAVTGYGVSLANVLPGDLIIFNSDQSHVGMAINAHEVVHAPQAGDVVKVTAIKYMGVVSTIRRIVG
jgi:cell wall-associated NlpC family hydrolase